MRKYIIGTMVGVLLSSVVVVLAGQIDSPAGPTAAGGQMYTLEQIYDRLNDGTAATKMTTFTEPSSGPASTMKTLDEIYALVGERAQVPKTGQTKCYNASGNEITCANSGQDGEYQKGVSWPSPRFTDNGNGTVTDNLTGLIWLKNANCPNGKKNWNDALTFANSLYDGWTGDPGGGDCGLSDGSSAGDWRLPNVRELHSLIHYGVYNPAVPNTAGTGKWSNNDPFTGVQSYYYWSSTTNDYITSVALYVLLTDGHVYHDVRTCTFSVWPVRGGQ